MFQTIGTCDAFFIFTHKNCKIPHNVPTQHIIMDTLQTLACTAYLKYAPIGTRIPFDVPGTTESWLEAWMVCTNLKGEDEELFGIISECLITGSSTRTRMPYSFRRRVEALSDSIGINRGPHERENLSDVILKLDPGFQWKRKKVTRSILERFYGS